MRSALLGALKRLKSVAKFMTERPSVLVVAPLIASLVAVEFVRKAHQDWQEKEDYYEQLNNKNL